MPDALFLFLACAIPNACLLAGMSWPRLQRTPLIATGAIVVSYLLFLLGTYIWAAQCWDCTYGTENKRGDAVWFALIFAWMPAAALVAAVWLGALVALVARWRGEARRLT